MRVSELMVRSNEDLVEFVAVRMADGTAKRRVGGGMCET